MTDDTNGAKNSGDITPIKHPVSVTAVKRAAVSLGHGQACPGHLDSLALCHPDRDRRDRPDKPGDDTMSFCPCYPFPPQVLIMPGNAHCLAKSKRVPEPHGIMMNHHVVVNLSTYHALGFQAK
jgi:hypothetical protein